MTSTITWHGAVVLGNDQSAERTIRATTEDYLFLRQTEQLSPASIKLYRFVFRIFMEFFGPDTDMATVDVSDLRRFMAEIYGRRYKPATIELLYNVLTIFFRWLEMDEVIHRNPMLMISKPKKPKSFPHYFSQEQVQKLLSGCHHTWTGQRARAILLTFLGTGIRVSELASLKMSSVNLGSRTMKVVGKGSKDRVVPIGHFLVNELERWFKSRAKFLRGEEHESLFVTKLYTAPAKNGIYNLVARMGERTGIVGVRCSPHTLRHTFATRFIQNGGDIYTLQKILGHKNPNTTGVYVHLALSDLRDSFDQHDPLPGFVESLGLERRFQA